MNSNTNPIDRALNINSESEMALATVEKIVATAKNDSATEDFKFARANIREVISNGNDALAELSTVARQSQNPRAYEVLAKLMDTMVVASTHLLSLQEQIRSIDKADVPNDEDARKHVTNNLFVGSTAELQRVIASMKPN